MGGDLGGPPEGATPKPHKSREQLGSRQGEKQLRLWSFLFLCQAVHFALLFLFLQRHSCPSDGVVCHQSLAPPLCPQRRLFLPSPSCCPQRKASITGCPGIVLGWRGGAARGLGDTGRVKTDQRDPRVDGILIESWSSLSGCTGFCRECGGTCTDSLSPGTWLCKLPEF